MARCIGSFLSVIFVFSFVAAAETQPAPINSASGVVPIRLGQAAVPLGGPWKFTVGDSPIDPNTGSPLWADPAFDDSHWETVDLTPAAGSYEPIEGISGFVPGWTEKGHSGYWGYGWYRLRVQIETQDSTPTPDHDPRLALEGPTNYDDVYQLFSNGRLLGGFGDFSHRTPVEYYNVPKLFPLPSPNASPNASPGEATGGMPVQVLAFRVWMGPIALLNEPEAGGLHNPPLLGEAGAVAADYQLRWLDLVRALSPALAEGILHALLALVAFSLLLFDRGDRVYLWIGAVFLLQAIYSAMEAIDSWTQHLSITADALLGDCLLFSLIMAGWVMVWWTWFGRRPAWIPRAAAALAVLWIVSRAIGQELFFGVVPHAVATRFWVVALLVRILFFALMLGIVIQGIRRQGLEGWLVLPAVLLRAVGVFSGELRQMGIRVSLHWFGANITLSEIATVLMALAVALLLLRRLLLSVRRQREMALDIKQAQEVQQVILPEARLSLPGWTIESEYRPAREVGGDFFQILPNKTDGSLLIVAGDVTGKGLKAGMLVALLVGAIRSTLDWSTDPVVLLQALNQRLIGRGDAQATGLALRIEADGAATLANAGHLPPYLNGNPMAVEGALPLGVIEGAEPSVLRFHLHDKDTLVLLSDGIAEAMDVNGRLFGFERVDVLVRTTKSAAEIARAAQDFGQQDDISVISLTRTAGLSPALP